MNSRAGSSQDSPFVSKSVILSLNDSYFFPLDLLDVPINGGDIGIEFVMLALPVIDDRGSEHTHFLFLRGKPRQKFHELFLKHFFLDAFLMALGTVVIGISSTQLASRPVYGKPATAHAPGSDPQRKVRIMDECSGVNFTSKHFMNSLLSDFVAFDGSKSQAVCYSGNFRLFVNSFGIFLKKFFNEWLTFRIRHDGLISARLHDVVVADGSEP